VPNDVLVAIVAHELGLTVIGAEPSIKFLDDLNAAIADRQRVWYLFDAMAGVLPNTAAPSPRARALQPTSEACACSTKEPWPRKQELERLGRSAERAPNDCRYV